jgi:ThiF family protein
MTGLPMMVLPAQAAARIEGFSSSWGILDLRYDPQENLVVVAGSSRKQEVRYEERPAWAADHYLRTQATRGAGVWYRVDPRLHVMHRVLVAQRLSVRVEALQALVHGGWRRPPPERPMPILTLARTDAGPDWAAWWVSAQGAQPGLVHVVENRPPLEFLGGAWPLGDLTDRLVTVIGVGSIGSVATEALAAFGMSRLALVDPDRLLEHNVVRHRLSMRDIGRHKVNAMADRLRECYAQLEVEPYPLDVVDDADVMRPLLARSTVVLCTADGVAPRRVASHLARRAAVPAVLACVLENGAIGEILRLRPGTGCLLCHRAHLVEIGAFDPEPRLDRGYGMGTRHLPMTAVPGDLALVADLAAKATVATILERAGHYNQRLPGDHAAIGLRPVPDLPAPFDVERAGEVRWSPVGPSREGCPTCTPP